MCGVGRLQGQMGRRDSAGSWVMWWYGCPFRAMTAVGLLGWTPQGGPPHHPRPINIKLSWVGVWTRDFIAKVRHRAHENA